MISVRRLLSSAAFAFGVDGLGTPTFGIGARDFARVKLAV
jgi:hypothetical protein